MRCVRRLAMMIANRSLSPSHGQSVQALGVQVVALHSLLETMRASWADCKTIFKRAGCAFVGRGIGNSVFGDGDVECDDDVFHPLLPDYGEENTESIRHLLDSWKRNSMQAAFIDSRVGAAKQGCERIARRMAATFGRRCERLAGAHDLLIKALIATATNDEKPIVPPDAIAEYDAIRRKITALPVKEAAHDEMDRAGSSESMLESPFGGGREGIGLGIDAGGTYTDAVLFEFGAGRILAKAKAPTTHWDYTLGIHVALAKLDASLLSQVRLTAVSTTLATNAIVEGRGQKTGLLVMPPYGWREVEGFKHSPIALIKGQLEIDGTVREPIDREQIRQVARRMVEEQDVAAFAVGGYASHANPSHEQEVKTILIAETGLSVTCAHEMSEVLNYRVRAETAALNARIIPCLRSLLDRLQTALRAHRIGAPVMIVRSDGSMMSAELACERPLETMLSGPAASVAGAAWLAGQSDAVVVDVGGTTTDLAVVRSGAVAFCSQGATVGGWQTHIPALSLHTLGLGGDSHVRYDRGALRFGPERVAPVSWLASVSPGIDQALRWIDEHVNPQRSEAEEVVLYAAVGSADDLALTEEERTLLELLAQRPYSAAEATAVMGKLHFSLLAWRRLTARHIVQRCALPPTDALHVVGSVKLWNPETAAAVCRWHAQRAQQDVQTFVRSLIRAFERKLAAEILKTQMAAGGIGDSIESQPAARAFLERALGGVSDGYSVRIELRHPVVGVGAPAACFVPGAAKLLHAEFVIPQHADVANAIGAITGSISLHRRVTISVNEEGLFRLGGVPDAPAFKRIEDATAHGKNCLHRLLDDLARKAGAVSPQVRIEIHDSSAPAAGGEIIFIERVIEGWACGQPDVRSDSAINPIA